VGVAKLNMLDRFLAVLASNKGVKKEMKFQSQIIEIGKDETTLPVVKNQRKPRSSSSQVTRHPKEIIQVVANTVDETKESAEIALPVVKKQMKPRSSSKQVARKPKEIIQVVANTVDETKESAEITLCREYNGEDMAELIGKLLAGTNHSYSVELKISQTR